MTFFAKFKDRPTCLEHLPDLTDTGIVDADEDAIFAVMATRGE